MTRPTKPEPNRIRELLIASKRVERWRIDRAWIIIEKMLLLYYPPYYATDGEQLIEQAILGLETYIDLLSRYEPPILAKAWKDVVSDHKTMGWPVVGKFVEACEYHSPKSAKRNKPGEQRGWDKQRFPPKARPDYSYQVEKGIMTQERADKLMAYHEQWARGDC